MGAKEEVFTIEYGKFWVDGHPTSTPVTYLFPNFNHVYYCNHEDEGPPQP